MTHFNDQIAQALGAQIPPRNLPDIIGQGDYRSYFDVTELALATTAAAVGEYAGLVGASDAQVDRRLALLWLHLTTRPVGWQAGSVWDAIAGDYPCADGWVRLHTNAPHHQKAALEVLGCAPTKDAVRDVLAGRMKSDVEAEIVANNGCAAAMHSLSDWQAHPQGQAVAQEPLIDWTMREGSSTRKELKGLKVLDLTRVLAGPVATRFLAGFGAQVLRIDPPHWNEPAVEVEVTLGKRCAGLDLKKSTDRARFETLLREADLLVHGYRPGALMGMGYGPDDLARLNPRLVDVSLCAYGWTGPWAGRRGFDSLVQMSCGIADEGMRRSGSDRPVPLPVQALDFATGYLVAAAALRAVRLAQTQGRLASVRLSLARTAQLLMSGGPHEATGESVAPQDGDFSTEIEDTTWGPVNRVKAPYSVDGISPDWQMPAGALRRHDASWG